MDELWKAEILQIKFLIQSAYEFFLSLSNVFGWGLAETPACIEQEERISGPHP